MKQYTRNEIEQCISEILSIDTSMVNTFPCEECLVKPTCQLLKPALVAKIIERCIENNGVSLNQSNMVALIEAVIVSVKNLGCNTINDIIDKGRACPQLILFAARKVIRNIQNIIKTKSINKVRRICVEKDFFSALNRYKDAFNNCK